MQPIPERASTSRNPDGGYEALGAIYNAIHERERDEISESVISGLKGQFEDMEARLQRQYDAIYQRILEQGRYQTASEQPANATMVKRALTVLRENYEFHECPIPRLFVVLPKHPELQEKLSRPLLNQFRLHFLCECSTHTADKGGHPLGTIHMTTHRGYDLINPSEFFHKYGTYVLAIMRVVRNWVDKESFFELPPGTSNHEPKDDKKDFDNIKENFFPLMDQTISCIEQHMSRAEEGAGSQNKKASFEALTRGELLQLKPYLRGADQNHTLGGLHRVFAAERYVKWGCADHVTEAEEFKLMATEKSGQVIAEDHKVIVTISSPIEARQFYNTLNGESRVRELDIKLDWDATKREFREFKTAIRNSKVVPVAFCETQEFQRLRSCQRLNCEGKYTAEVLEHWLTDGPISASAKIQRQFSSFFKIHPKRFNLLRTAEALSKKHVTGTLQEITMEDSLNSVYFKLNHGKVESVEAEIDLSANSVESVIQYITTGSLTKLTLTADSTPSVQWLKDNLIDLLTMNPRLTELLVRSNSIEALKLLEDVTKDEFSSECKGVFRKFQMHVTASDIVASVVEFPKDSSSKNISTYVSLRSAVVPGQSIDLGDFFEKYGSTIKILETNETFTDAHAEKLANVSLTSLTLNPGSLDDKGLGFMEDVIRRSELTQLCFDFNNLQDNTQLLKAKRLLSGHKDQLTGLTLRGNGDAAGEWISAIKKIIPDRKNTPGLEDFALNCSSLLPDDPTITEWIAEIISTPVQPSTSEISQSTTNTSRNLKSVSFENGLIFTLEWETVVDALFSYTPEILSLGGPETEEVQLRKLVNKSFDVSNHARGSSSQGFSSSTGVNGIHHQRRQRYQDQFKVEIPENAIFQSRLDPGINYSPNFNAAGPSKGKHREQELPDI
ncbi:hypothetical protein BGX26_011900 [Mortierella sp. AD094]|nr:hypothetical protein BGX26_011900 [Mortierella sp. AD094]